MSRWNAERVAVLRRMWVDGDSAANIAERLGVSRGAVLGKVRRIGVRRGAMSPPPAVPVRKAARVPRVARLPAARLSASVAAVSAVAGVADGAADGVHILDISAGACRYPLWGSGAGIADKRCCGAPVEREGGSWCAAHAGRVFARSVEDDGTGADGDDHKEAEADG